MKKSLLYLLVPIIFVMGCGEPSRVNIAASGSPYEIFVVTDKAIWKGEVGDTIRSIMNEEVLWVNQPEPIFTIHNITPQALNNITRKHRNLLIINTNSKADSATLSYTENKWATGQIVIEIEAPNDNSAAMFIGENSKTITDFLHILEQKRMNRRAAKYNDKYVEELIKKKYGFDMVFPRGYRVANDIDNFLWLTYEMPIASQGVVIYTFDRAKEGEKLDLVAQRNLAVMSIPGPVDGSYMGTDVTFYPESTPVVINGVSWIETRGFWKAEGDWMGGPFINYVTLDKVNNRYIGIDLYVYSPSPKYPKRNYIRQLESLMLGVTIPKN